MNEIKEEERFERNKFFVNRCFQYYSDVSDPYTVYFKVFQYDDFGNISGYYLILYEYGNRVEFSNIDGLTDVENLIKGDIVEIDALTFDNIKKDIFSRLKNNSYFS